MKFQKKMPPVIPKKKEPQGVLFLARKWAFTDAQKKQESGKE